MDYIGLKDVIVGFIKYDSGMLEEVVNDMKNEIVCGGRKGQENKLVFNGLGQSVGVGGIDCKNDGEIIIGKEDEMVIEMDVG